MSEKTSLEERMEGLGVNDDGVGKIDGVEESVRVEDVGLNQLAEDGRDDETNGKVIVEEYDGEVNVEYEGQDPDPVRLHPTSISEQDRPASSSSKRSDDNERGLPTPARQQPPRVAKPEPTKTPKQSRAFNDCKEDLRAEMRETFENCVYVFWSQSKKLSKIGIATKPLARIKQVSRCGCGCDFGDLQFTKLYPVAHPKKVEDLAHAELRDFNFLHEKLTKAGHPYKVPRTIQHREWFNVEPDEAEKTVKRWVNFFEEAYNPEGCILDAWSRHTRSLPEATAGEKKAFEQGNYKKCHQLRNKRFDLWLREGVEKIGKKNKEKTEA